MNIVFLDVWDRILQNKDAHQLHGLKNTVYVYFDTSVRFCCLFRSLPNSFHLNIHIRKIPVQRYYQVSSLAFKELLCVMRSSIRRKSVGVYVGGKCVLLL